MRHAGRFEETLCEQLPDRHARGALDHPAGDDVTGVAVRPARAGLEVELARAVLRDERVGRDVVLHAAVDEIERVEVGIAGHVLEKVEQRDVARARQRRVVGGDLAIERKLAVFGKQERGGAGELLGNRADGEGGVRRDRGAGFPRCLAVAFHQDELALAHDRQRRAHGVAGGEASLDPFVDRHEIERLRFGGVGLAARGAISGGARESEQRCEGEGAIHRPKIAERAAFR